MWYTSDFHPPIYHNGKCGAITEYVLICNVVWPLGELNTSRSLKILTAEFCMNYSCMNKKKRISVWTQRATAVKSRLVNLWRLRFFAALKFGFRAGLWYSTHYIKQNWRQNLVRLLYEWYWCITWCTDLRV